jgi:tRNA A37 threonylcarbamoyladenosine dehydratase
MRRELKGLGVPHLTVLYSREKPRKPDISPKEDPKERPVPGSVSFVPPVAGLLIAGEVIRRLAGL